MWRHLEHKNIVPLLGVASTSLHLISEWMPGGDLIEYISKNPSADRLGLVSVLPLHLNLRSSRLKLSDVAEGLQFLHSCNVVHGDLKGVGDHSRPT